MTGAEQGMLYCPNFDCPARQLEGLVHFASRGAMDIRGLSYARIRQLESAAQSDAEPRDTSFLGGMRDSLFGKREGRGSVPSVRPADAAPMSSAWQTGTQSQPMQAPQPMPGMAGGA